MFIKAAVSADGVVAPSGVDVTIETVISPVMRFRPKLVNNSGKAIHLDNVRLHGFTFPGKGEDLRLYCESWTAVSASASVRYGECDLRVDPNYMPFAISEPDKYDWQTPNRFSAENAIVLNNKATGACMLIGFVTTARYYNRFQVEFDENGVKTLDAYILGDGKLVEPGEELILEEFIILEGSDGYGMLETYASILGASMNAISWDHIPTGWCSWYYYFSKVTEQDVLENLEFFKAHAEEYPIEYFQIDDGYQRTPGDWLQPSDKFPKGIEHTVRTIASYGFKPGLWFAPFMVCANSELYAEHPEYLLHDREGNILHPIKWRGTDAAILDCTRSDVREHLKNMFRQVRSWGCTYIKLDFMMYESCVAGAVYSDPKATRCDAFRMGMQAIRDGAGEDMFILGGTVIIGPCVGIINGSRYGSDITPYWKNPVQLGKEAPNLPNVVRNLIVRRYMHWKLWVNDPDVLIARDDNNKLTENEVLFWLDALYMAGGALLLSDRMSTLSPERAKLCKELMDSPDALVDVRPEDLFEREVPRIWSGVRKSDGRKIIAFFNPDDEKCVINCDVTKLHIPGVTSYRSRRSGETVSAVNNIITITLEPHSSVVLEEIR